MKIHWMGRRAAGRAACLAAAWLAAALPAGAQGGPRVNPDDPRARLGAGWTDAGDISRGMELVTTRAKPAGFFNPADPGDFGFAVSDMAFRGSLAFLGGYNGLQVWDISNPASPTLRGSLVCPGGQGDVSVYGNLLFVSVEEPRGRVDCGTQGIEETASPQRFLGVRIFDITSLDAPRQVAAVQTCRGSHTHTLVVDPDDRASVYIYVSGTGEVRPEAELAGCRGGRPEEDPRTAYFRIDVIRVPLADPAQARIVSGPRIFADPRTGNPAGLWPGGTHGEGTQETAETDQCHDITVYPALGLGLGACSGNGILLDIRDPVNPRRIDEVSDPNFAYWHSATFSNDASKVLFTDEWGGGTAAHCLAADRPQWGADAIFTLANRRDMRLAGYYKLPAAQTETENCVAHNGSLIPVPGRDLMVQAWYQGGISVFDFTDPARPMEVAYFDRGPVSPTELVIGGHWSAYWYNGHIYASEIVRGLDVLRLTPSTWLSHNEIEAARLVRQEQFNPQMQERFEWPAAFVVARAYVDQLVRNKGLPVHRIGRVAEDLNAAERMGAGAGRRAALTRLAGQLDRDARTAGDPERVRALAAAVRRLAGASR